MTGKKLMYWVCTLVGCAVLIVTGVLDLMGNDWVTKVITKLKYPGYVMQISGICKIVAAVVLLLPHLPKLKEWAYAGCIFLMIAAISSHVMAEDEVIKILLPVVTLLVLTASYLSLAERLGTELEED
jgi:uncharacterized membrane protein YphA (DoxX/SURF4 family)